MRDQLQSYIYTEKFLAQLYRRAAALASSQEEKNASSLALVFEEVFVPVQGSGVIAQCILAEEVFFVHNEAVYEHDFLCRGYHLVQCLF